MLEHVCVWDVGMYGVAEQVLSVPLVEALLRSAPQPDDNRENA